METCSLSDLKNNFVSILNKIGIDKSIELSPIYDSIIDEVNELLAFINFGNAENVIMCSIINNKVITKLNKDNAEYTIEVEKKDNTSFTVSLIRTDIEYIKIYEKYIKFGEDKKISTLEGLCDRDTNVIDNNKTMLIDKLYDDDGIMVFYDIVRFKPNSVASGLESNPKDIILYIPYNYSSPLWSSYYSSRITLSREYLDIAKVNVDYKLHDINYSALAKLSDERSLRDLYLPDSYRSLGSLPRDFSIEPLTEDEINKLLNGENDKVRNGLLKYIKDRKTIIYESKNDPDFVYGRK